MELDSDLNIQKNHLDKSIRVYRNWAILFASLTVIPFGVAALYNFTNPSYLSLEETGSYIGGFSAPSHPYQEFSLFMLHSSASASRSSTNSKICAPTKKSLKIPVSK